MTCGVYLNVVAYFIQILGVVTVHSSPHECPGIFVQLKAVKLGTSTRTLEYTCWSNLHNSAGTVPACLDRLAVQRTLGSRFTARDCF